MECSECRYGKYEILYGGYYCRNPNTANYNHLNRMKEIGCDLGETGISKAAPTNLFTEPKLELYSVVCKIDTSVDCIHREYLVNATSQERALDLVTEYLKNTSHSDEVIVGDPIVHVLRREGIIDLHQVGCY